jgi:hypothetical protein
MEADKKIVYVPCIFIHILRVYNPKNLWAHPSPMKKEETTWKRDLHMGHNAWDYIVDVERITEKMNLSCD